MAQTDHAQEYVDPQNGGGYGPQGTYGPPPAKKTHKLRNGLLVGLGVLVLLGIIGAVSGKHSSGTSTPATPGVATAAAKAGVLTTSSNTSHPPTADVTISSCATNTLGWPSADVVVTNHSAKTSNYLVTVAFVSKDGKTQLDTGMASVDNLTPGQATAPQEASGTNQVTGGFTCRVAQVERYASTD